VSDDCDDLLHKANIRGYLRIPFMHKVTKDDGNQGIEFEIDGRRAGEGREHLVERLFVCRWTEDLQSQQLQDILE
jgi:hypothetical protein